MRQSNFMQYQEWQIEYVRDSEDPIDRWIARKGTDELIANSFEEIKLAVDRFDVYNRPFE